MSDVPDNELGAVVEFDEDELDEAQTEADVKNITTKHQITIEELKREVLGSVRKKTVTFLSPAWPNGLASKGKLKTWVCLRLPLSQALCALALTCDGLIAPTLVAIKFARKMAQVFHRLATQSKSMQVVSGFRSLL